MKITICGSIAFYDEMLDVKKKLEALGHEVKVPPPMRTGENGQPISSKDYYEIRHAAKPEDTWVWEEKQRGITDHFEKVAWSEAILVLNYDKNDIKNYIGPNTLMEMGLALWLKKPVYLLNSIPKMQYMEEICGLKPVVIIGDLTKIR